jgi:Aerotolerance regulator N-terminal/von Willebrand factor type A domain
VGFLSPWFLAGLLALGLPIWLHLLRQFKRTPQPFSSLMFFERRIQSSTRHRRLRYMALLAARLALLALLALAFANPFINRAPDAVKRRTLAVIAVDRSFSMRFGKRLEQAKAKAHDLVDKLPPRTAAEVLAVAGRVEHLTQMETDRGALNAAIDSIQPSDEANSFGEVSRALRIMDQSTGMHIEASLISDLQQTSMPASFTDLQLGPHTKMQIYAVGTSSSPNWAVENVSAPQHIYDPAQVRITATVTGWQSTPCSRKVMLALDGKTIAERPVSVPDCGRGEIEFTGFDIPYGAHRGEVRIEPHDGLPQDDSFHFAMERSDPRTILFLYRQGRSRDAMYYKSAIESSKGTGLAVQAEPFEQAPGETLSRYAFVVLSDPGTLDENLQRSLSDFVSRGGAVLESIGATTLQTGEAPLLAGQLQRSNGTQGAGWVDNGDPALLGSGLFQNVEFIDPPALNPPPHARVIARFANGKPLLLEERSGEGRVLLFASTLDNSSSDFPLHASYLPFVVQTATYLSGAESSPSSLPVDAPVLLRRSAGQTTSADVIGPDGKHELTLSEATHALSFNLPAEGFYEVQRADGHRQLLAANADRRESDLTPVSAETLELWRNTGVDKTGPESGATETQARPWSLWRYVLALVVAAALIESIFANRYLRRERQAA